MPPQPSAFTRFVDSAVAFVNPVWGVQRMAARQVLNQFNYDGAYGSPGRRDTSGGTLFRNASPESWAVQRDAIKLMWESRDMESNFCFYRGVLTRLVQYALGQIRWQSRTGDSAVDDAYEGYWEQWCKEADVTQRHHLNTIVRLALRGMLRDRDFGLALGEDEAGNLRVRGIEADRIGNPLIVGMVDDKKIHGVHLGDNGEPILYEIFQRTRTNQYKPEMELPPARFLHLFDPLRIDQYRGVCWAAPALPHMRDLYEALEAEMQAIKFAGSYAAFIKTTMSLAQQGAAAFDEKRNDGVNTYKVQPGTIQRLTQGEDLIFAQTPARPSGSFIAFFETKVREICTALNVPFGFGWNMALLGGVTARIEVAQMKRTLDYFRDLVKDKLLEPLVQRVLLRGVASRAIPPHPKRGTGKWGFGADITGDVGHDVNADIALLQAGIMTKTELIEGKYGGDFEEKARIAAREIQIHDQVAQETSVPIELQDPSLPNATQLLAAMKSRGDPEAEQSALESAGLAPPPEEQALPPVAQGLAAAHGNTAVKGILDVMKNYNQGLLTREQAVTTLVAAFGIDLAEAEMLVP